GGPGNPSARRVAEIRKALLDAVTAEDIQRIFQRLVAQAVLGDVASAKLVLSYVLGKPAAVVNPDSVDQEEVRMHLQNVEVRHLQEKTANLSAPSVRLR